MKYIFRALVWIAIIACAVVGFGTRIINPDMSEMRLWLTYWKLYTACMASVLVLGPAWILYEAIAQGEHESKK